VRSPLKHKKCRKIPGYDASMHHNVSRNHRNPMALLRSTLEETNLLFSLFLFCLDPVIKAQAIIDMSVDCSKHSYRSSERLSKEPGL